jgi:hypothetical protein
MFVEVGKLHEHRHQDKSNGDNPPPNSADETGKTGR